MIVLDAVESSDALIVATGRDIEIQCEKLSVSSMDRLFSQIKHIYERCRLCCTQFTGFDGIPGIPIKVKVVLDVFIKLHCRYVDIKIVVIFYNG